MKEAFTQQGYIGPIKLFDQREIRRYYKNLVRATRCEAPLDWQKGWAVKSAAFFALASHPKVLALVTELLGDDVLLWGSRLIHKSPGEKHDWHSDLESSDPSGKTVSVWLALKDCSKESSLTVVPGSHRFGETVQQQSASRADQSAAVDPETVLTWARDRKSDSGIVTAETQVGEAILFDGRLWHGSNNTTNLTRSAVLLQYATPDTAIRIPASFSWPYRNLASPLPPCVMISGQDQHQINRTVRPPSTVDIARGPRLTTRAHELTLPFSPGEKSWLPVPVFGGSTAGQRSLTCHVSALRAGQSPHLPHRHEEEEILMVLHGEADVILPDLAEGQQRKRLAKGDCVYYPAQFTHTIEGVSENPVNYLMLKWQSASSCSAEPSGFRQWSIWQDVVVPTQPTIQFDIVLSASTRWLHKLQCHTTTMPAGVGYDAHTDSYDVVMIVLQGQLESIGHSLAPYGVYFYAAGEQHGAHNPGPEAVYYVVFELHTLPGEPIRSKHEKTVAQKLTDPRHWLKFFNYRINRLLAKLTHWLTRRKG